MVINKMYEYCSKGKEEGTIPNQNDLTWVIESKRRNTIRGVIG